MTARNKARTPAILNIVALCMFTQGLAAGGDAWQTKPYTDWTEAEALKVLQDSPWSRTAFIQMRPGSAPALMPAESEPDGVSGRQHSTCCNTLGTEGGVARTVNPVDQSVSAVGPAVVTQVIYFRVLCFSSVKIRQALTRLRQLRGETPEPEAIAALQGPLDDIVIAVASPYIGSLERATVDDLRPLTYLRVKKGRKEALILKDFISPAGRKDGMALFIFPRTVNGQPAFDLTDGQVEFATGEGTLKIQVAFKLEKMAIAGALDF